MDLMTLIGGVIVAAVGYYLRHRQGDSAPPAQPVPQPTPTPMPVPQPGPAPQAPALPGLPASVLAILQRPAAQALLSLLAAKAATTPTTIDDEIVRLAQALTLPPAQPSPAKS